MVYPLVTENEMTVYFLEILPNLFYDKLAGNASRSFANIVMPKEMIKKAIKMESPKKVKYALRERMRCPKQKWKRFKS